MPKKTYEVVYSVTFSFCHQLEVDAEKVKGMTKTQLDDYIQGILSDEMYEGEGNPTDHPNFDGLDFHGHKVMEC